MATKYHFSRFFSEYSGEVIVQRLNIQTLWIHPPPYENARVCGFDWRPDVHVLAVGRFTITITTTTTNIATEYSLKLLHDYAFNLLLFTCVYNIGYDSGKIILIDVENHQILYTQELGTKITHLSWTQNTDDSYDDFEEVQGNTRLVCMIFPAFFLFCICTSVA